MRKHYNKALLASLISMLVACNSDNNNNDNNDPVVDPVNHAPVATADTATLMADTSLTIDVLINDSDADGDTLTITSASTTAGAVTVVDNALVFDATGAMGEITITYAVADGNGGVAESTVTVMVTSHENAYVGTQTCLTCHSDKASFLETGHNFKLNKVVNNEQPTFPFTDVTGAIDFITGADNTRGAPTGYDEASYTVGGYHWKMRWLDADGYIVTGSGVQLNLEANDGVIAAESMGGYHAGEVDKKYNCGNCHTTGWKRNTTEDGDVRNLDGHQDGLIGMDGTFAMAGVQCESCHGAGGLHVQNGGNTDFIVTNAVARTTDDFLADDMAFGKAVTCAECHTRDGEKDYPSYVSPYNQAYPNGSTIGGRIIANGSGLSKHHQTTDEILGVNPDTGVETRSAVFISTKMNCTTCHDSHMSTVNADKPGHEGAVTKACVDCHSGQEFAGSAIAAAVHGSTECTTCHMPEMAKSAITHQSSAGVTFGDVKSHLFTVNLASDAKAFADTDDDGKDNFQMPWVTAEFSCGQCHADFTDRAAALSVIHQ